MFKRIGFLLLLCSSLLLQGCFEILEQVFVKADGSGTFQLVLNMSKSKTKINSIMKMKTVNGHDVPSKADITAKIADIEKTVSATPGIGNVKTQVDFDNYIATLNCNFTNAKNLNAAVKNIGDKQKTNRQGAEKMYDYNAVPTIFSRLNHISLKKDYEQLSNADREVFTTANYTCVFRFEKEVAAVSNRESKIAGNKKAVMLKQNALDIITGKKTIENRITLK